MEASYYHHIEITFAISRIGMTEVEKNFLQYRRCLCKRYRNLISSAWYCPIIRALNLANIRLNSEDYRKSAVKAESTSGLLMLSAAASASADGKEESSHSVSLADTILALENVNLSKRMSSCRILLKSCSPSQSSRKTLNLMDEAVVVVVSAGEDHLREAGGVVESNNIRKYVVKRKMGLLLVMVMGQVGAREDL